MSNANDAAVSNFQHKFTAHYGAGAIPWQQILAALLAMLGGCTLPTAANIKAQVQRPLVKARLFIRLLASGVPAGSCGRVIAATEASIAEATDDEIGAFVVAAQETD